MRRRDGQEPGAAATRESKARLIRAAHMLRAARFGPRLVDFPLDVVPADLESAYRIQELVIGDKGIGGWKMGARSSPAGRRCAALSAEWLLADGAAIPPTLFHAPEIEVEIAFRLVADLPAGKEDCTMAEVRAALGSAHAVFEVVESRFVDRRSAPPLSLLADAYSCGAVCVGSGAANWDMLDYAALDIRLFADGSELEAAQGGASLEEMLEGLVWLANHASRRGRGLRAGQFVLTGARIGPRPVAHMRELVATIDRIGAVRLHWPDAEILS